MATRPHYVDYLVGQKNNGVEYHEVLRDLTMLYDLHLLNSAQYCEWIGSAIAVFDDADRRLSGSRGSTTGSALAPNDTQGDPLWAAKPVSEPRKK